MAVHCGTTGKQKLRKSPATHLVEFGGGGAFEPGIFTRRQPASGGHCAGSIQTLIRGRKMSHEAGGWRCDFIVRKPAAGRPASAIRRPRNRRRAEGSGAPQFSGHLRSRPVAGFVGGNHRPRIRLRLFPVACPLDRRARKIFPESRMSAKSSRFARCPSRCGNDS